MKRTKTIEIICLVVSYVSKKIKKAIENASNLYNYALPGIKTSHKGLKKLILVLKIESKKKKLSIFNFFFTLKKFGLDPSKLCIF